MASGRMSKGFAAPGADYVTYTNFEGKILRTITRVKATVTNCFRGQVELEIGEGDHRMAQNLRQLGLKGKKPFLMQRCDHSRTQLLEGEEVAEWPTPELAYSKPGEYP